jgi:hypothetical protein
MHDPSDHRMTAREPVDPGAGAAPDIEPRRPRPERHLDLYAALGVSALASVVYVLALVLELTPPTGMAVVLFAATPICAAFALMVLPIRARAEDDGPLAWFSAGLAVAWVAMTLQLISFPAVSREGGPLGTDNQSNAALYLLFHLAVAAGALAGALGAPARGRVVATAVGVALAFLTAANAIPLPTLLRPDTSFTGPLLAAEYGLVVLLALAAVLWIMRAGREASTLRGWVGVALSLSVYDVLLNAFAAERFSAVWWASLSIRVASYAVLAVGAVSGVLLRLSETESYSQTELQRREDELRASLGLTSQLLGCAQDLARTVTPAEVAEVLCKDAVGASRLTHSVLLVSRPGEQTVVLGSTGYDTRPGVEATGTGWDSPYASAFAPLARDPLFLDDAEAVRARIPAIASTPLAEAACLVALPVRVASERLGTLLVWDTVPRPLAPSQRDILKGIATQGGQALRRALAFENEANAAATLQRSLLSAGLPHRDDLAMAARYVPGERGLRVGGDWYDCVQVNERLVALVVGDVMGKGLRAAAVMGQMRTAVRSLAGADPSPAAVLSGLDRLHSMLEVDEIATVAYVLLDVESRLARVARAGHLPPILIDPEGRATLLEAGGSPPLGSPTPERVEAEVEIRPGSTLVLYTDGIVEDRVTGLDGLEGFVDLVEQTAQRRSGDVDALATDLLLSTFASQRQDDIALLVARVQGVPSGDQPASTAEPALTTSRGAASVAAQLAGTGSPDHPSGVNGEVHAAWRPTGPELPTGSQFVWSFPENPQTPAAVRRRIRQSCRSLPPDLREDTLLLASELVTNAVRHGTGEVTVRLWPGKDVVRVEVTDASPHRPEPADRDLAAEDGRGLQIVGALASRWGTAPSRAGAGKTVWFELDV